MAKPEPPVKPEKPPKLATVLVVDDDASILRLIEMILKRRGFTVLKAENGDDAFRLAVHQQPDAILLDVNLPGMNGFEVVKKLRAKEETAKIPVAFLTASKELDTFRAAKDAGGILFIPKPFKPESLIQSIGILLAARGKKL